MKKTLLAATIIAALNLISNYLFFFPFSEQNHVLAENVYALTEEEAIETLATGVLYARINGKQTEMYADATLKERMFTLPKTYYLCIKEILNDVCRAVYCFEDYDYARGIYGYVKTENLLFTEVAPSSKSFPNVFPKFEGNGTFYKNTTFTQYYSAGETAGLSDPFFYGYYNRSSEERYCYVLCGGKFGYYPAEVFEEITVQPHPDAMPAVKPVQPITSESSSLSGSASFLSTDTNKVIFICVLCVISVSAVYVIFLPKRKKKEDFDTDEMYN